MDTTDDSYLSFFSEKPQSFLLQNNEEALGLNVEPIFTEIGDSGNTWAIDGLPILMNAPLISEEHSLESAMDAQDTNMELYGNKAELESSEISFTYPIEIPGKGFVTSDGLFLSNDVLMQLNLQTEESVESAEDNSQTECTEEIYTIKYEDTNSNLVIDDASDVVEQLPNLQLLDTSRASSEVIHLISLEECEVNVAKTTQNKGKSGEQKQNRTGRVVLNLDDFFKTVIAYKCMKCTFYCEERADIMKHTTEVHMMSVEKSYASSKRSNPPPLISKQNKELGASKRDVDMKSILSTNNAANHRTVFLCSECNLGYSTTLELKNHMIAKHKLITLNNGTSDIIQLELAEEKVSSTSELSKDDVQKLKHLKIIKKQNASKKMKCSIKGCDTRFSKEEYRTRHEKCHVDGQKNRYKCTVCEKQYSVWKLCSLHLWKCHSIDLGLLTCPMCYSYKTIMPYKLMAHMAIHGNAAPFLCNVCGKTFKQSSQLRNHYVCHKKATVEMPPWATQQKCNVCENYFANSKSLKKHIQSVHNKFKPFICNICGHKTARKAMLDLHLRQHTGEKPHKCSMCDYRTGDHNSYRRHMMRHSGLIKYSCPHCEYQSIQSTAYKNHLANKHPGLGGSYSCLLCSFNTVNEVTYHNHLKEHANKLKKDGNSKRNVAHSSTNSVHSLLTSSQPMETTILKLDVDDEETQNCYLSSDHTEDTVDTGGITIPAGLELQV